MRRLAAVGVMLLAGATAAAQEFPPVTDRDFALDLTVGTVLGSIRTIGMGGASVALAEQASGMGANPAAPAVRRATSNDWWDWDVSLDWMDPNLGQDIDNNGESDGGAHASVVTAGLALELNHAGIGLDLTAASRTADDLTVGALVGRILVAYAFPDDVITVGVGLRGGDFVIDRGMTNLTSAVSWSGTGGVLWRPRDLDLRLGGSFSLPVKATVPDCSACGRVVPREARLPWELALGAAWRFGPTRWNQQVRERWRDERAVIVAADAVFTGALPHSYGLQRYAEGQLQPSGRKLAMSLRAGAEVEAIPGWLRLRAGSYWEPGRTEGSHGRLHGTFGVAVRFLSFHLWSWQIRLRASLTIDGARDYANGGLSLGFW